MRLLLKNGRVVDPANGRDGEFDVLIMGGVAFGAAATRDAAFGGLRTALVERSDFIAGALAE